MIAIIFPDLMLLFGTATVRHLAPGEALFRAGDPVSAMTLVTAGGVDLARHTAAGGRIVLQRAGPGEVLAEASAFAVTYHCDGVAACPSEVRILPLGRFRERLLAEPTLALVWAGHLAASVQDARARAEIRTLRTVQERLDAWLAMGRALPARGHRQELAAELGVTREALYRELARRRGAGSANSPERA